MIVEQNCAASKRVVAVNNIPFIVIPEYSYKYFGSNSVPTGPGLEASGMFLGSFGEIQTIHVEDEQKIGKPLIQIEEENQLFLAYLNNHASGPRVNPDTFKKELLSYLYFVTSTIVNSESQKSAEVFTRITPEIFESYIYVSFNQCKKVHDI